jgi:CheY-like chemotaxis protein
MRILVVDDTTAVRRTTSRLLPGHDVTVSPDGMDALEWLAAEHFDVVIVDLLLPCMHGPDLIREIRAFAPKTRILAVSGAPNPGTEAHDFLAKPFTGEELRKRIDQWDANVNPNGSGKP